MSLFAPTPDFTGEVGMSLFAPTPDHIGVVGVSLFATKPYGGHRVLFFLSLPTLALPSPPAILMKLNNLGGPPHNPDIYTRHGRTGFRGHLLDAELSGRPYDLPAISILKL